MKRWLAFALLVFIGAAGWRIGGSLSSDALSMAVGVLFGVMAGVPAALLAVADGRRRTSELRTTELAQIDSRGQAFGRHVGQPYGQMYQRGMFSPQPPPVIIVTGQNMPSHNFQGNSNDLEWTPQDNYPRHFTVVGDLETVVEEW